MPRDAIELDEAFAGQGLAVPRRPGLVDDAEHVNPNGGAIALPLSMPGGRSARSASASAGIATIVKWV